MSSYFILMLCVLLMGAEVSQEYPTTIWMYWGNRMPWHVPAYIERNIKIFHHMPLIFLNPDNVKFYLDMKTFPKHFYWLCDQNKADYIRLRLLEKYGGIWIDATTYFKDSKIVERYHEEAKEQQAQLLALSSFDWGIRYIENGFLIAPKGSSVINAWVKEYHKAIDQGFRDYIVEKHYEGVDLVKKLYTLGDPNIYLTAHVALQTALQKRVPNDTKIIVKRTEDTIFKLNVMCNWNDTCVVEKWLNDPSTRELEALKMSRALRRVAFDAADNQKKISQAFIYAGLVLLPVFCLLFLKPFAFIRARRSRKKIT
ncbi:putative Capsular polysaccharide synthesis protein [Monocercomonoides exilis]|uniref:putative Capsular polysaccharide synthesis protein n=1 Tax=Monocercomonoides exilis TaxID=2049356 RepID=UPI00355AB9CE|nr:putative Capsular polysaccharide synthesis protein [Monocercomonoides exilis]|eukprot:MONOS_160.1-p1 / transcript=MONOS_160.1 / gene=MONOS_160 / organism=Monocercomonoides_exilis_PA203 / gene_product=unspecified product / transcript_product=unspecified product / location=Mono_scaffold00003:60773-61708(-) / protein_length=311 / sequence_SO=supercontig / SO=protein_coding / is_pseudo=false